MKPKNKFQQHVIGLSKSLPKITEPQKQWAYKHCFDHIGKRNAKGIITCLECGHSWQGYNSPLSDNILGCECPNCSAKLKVNATRQRVFRQTEYFGMVATCGGFQVIRFLYVSVYHKAGHKAEYFCKEVVQRWIAPNGKTATVARLRGMSRIYYDIWNFNSDLEIRHAHRAHDINPIKFYPRQRLIPELQRCGYKETFGKLMLTPFDLIRTLLSEPKAETLLKTGQWGLLHYFVYNSRNVNDYWSSIRIATRNGYMIKDAHSWIDYIDLLRFFGRDLHNAKYVCPSDLKTEHDRYVAKKRAFLERQQIEKKREQALEHEQQFREMKAKFFGIGFTDGLIEIRVLESVEEIMIEGEKMHHCVFTNDYHLKPDSLILSACMNGERIETIEVSLKTLKVVQSRGVCNKNSNHHDQIVKLVNKNIKHIRSRMSA